MKLACRIYRCSELGEAFGKEEVRIILAEGLTYFSLEGNAGTKTAASDWRKAAIAWAMSERTAGRQDWIAEQFILTRSQAT